MSNTSTILHFAGLLILCFVIFYRPFHSHDRPSFSTNQPGNVEKFAWKQELEKNYPFVVAEVPTLEWDYDDASFAEKVVDLRVPKILKNTPASSWRAMKEWRPSYLSKHIKSFKSTQVHENRTFSYFKEIKPLSKLPDIRKAFKGSAFVKTDMDSKEFFKHASEYPPKGLFYYAVISVDDLGAAKKDLFPLDPFVVVPPSVKSKLLQEQIEKGGDSQKLVIPQDAPEHRLTTCWFGPSGATTQAHYDVHNNFYVQIHGQKRFILFPPEQYRNLYINGFLHTGAQQSQVDLENPDLDKFPLFSDAYAMDAFLEPGDVLYIPALWFHHVIALDLSFSVSIWSREEETVHMWNAEKMAPPIRNSWSPTTKAIAGLLFLQRLIDLSFTHDERQTFDFLSSPDKFFLDLWNIRYKNMIENHASSLKRQQQQKPNQYCKLEELMITTDEERLGISRKEIDSLYQFASQISSLMKKVQSPLQRAIWVGNYCEHIALAVTDISSIVSFIQSLAECQ